MYEVYYDMNVVNFYLILSFLFFAFTAVSNIAFAEINAFNIDCSRQKNVIQ